MAAINRELQSRSKQCKINKIYFKLK